MLLFGCWFWINSSDFIKDVEMMWDRNVYVRFCSYMWLDFCVDYVLFLSIIIGFWCDKLDFGVLYI